MLKGNKELHIGNSQHMIIYSHRGNLAGKTTHENDPVLLEETIAAGFHVEVDLWHVEGKYLLGHDGPEYPIELSRFDRHEVVFHLKNAFVPPLECADAFAIDNDRYVLTLRRLLWTNYGQSPTPQSIMCAPDLVGAGRPVEEFIREIRDRAFGVCTDYPLLARETIASA
jgi:hypothetical protein